MRGGFATEAASDEESGVGRRRGLFEALGLAEVAAHYMQTLPVRFFIRKRPRRAKVTVRF